MLPHFLLPQDREWLAPVLSYLLGSVAFGLLFGFARGVDIRKSGSGNIGASNAGRVLGRPFGLAAFAGDFLKGWAPTWWIAPSLALTPERQPSLAVLCGAAAVCGHVWPIYFRFRGGKAVATGCGAITGIDPVIFLTGGAAWLVTMALFRFAGLSSLVMGFTFPVVAWWRMKSQHYGSEVLWGTIALAFLILARHRSNIARMLAGTEPRVGRRRPSDQSHGV